MSGSEVKIMNTERMENNEGPRKVITGSDLNKAAWLSALLQGTFNFETYQGAGWSAMLGPALKKIYGSDKEGLRTALKDNGGFMNTQPVLSSFLQGLLISLYETKSERNLVNNVRVSLFGPLAGVGDSIFWFTLLPIMAGLCSSLASKGNLVGPLIYLIVYIGVFFSRFFFIRLGYRTGTKSISMLGGKTKDFSTAASILGVTVIGGLIASYINVAIKLSIRVSDTVTLSIQQAFFDKIIPNLLPILITALMYYLLAKRKMSPISLILGILGVCLVFSWFGIV